MDNKINIAILGFGPFGQALTSLILEANPDQTITCLDLDATFVLEQIQQHFPTHTDRLIALSSKNPTVQEVYKTADVLIVSVGSKFMLDVMKEILPSMKSGSVVINVAKALSPTGKLFFDEFQQFQRSDIAYAALAGGMAAKDIMENKTTGATIAVSSDAWSDKLQSLFSSYLLEVQMTSDVRGVEMAGVLKNIISIQAGYKASTGDAEIIDALVAYATNQIKNHASDLHIQDGTFDKSYCRDHPEYGDIKTSCYGGTRNFMLGQLRRKHGSLSAAIQHCEKERITVEGANTLRILAQEPAHLLNKLDFVVHLTNQLQ